VPVKRATYHHRDLSNALVSAAVELIADRGVAGFSLREAARAIGVDPAACYRHFRDKDALLDEIARRGFTQLARRMERALARRRDPAARLQALGGEYVRFAFDESAAFRTMFATSGVDARVPRRRGEYGRSPYDILDATTADWLRERKRPSQSRRTIARVLWSGVHGVAALAIEGSIPLSREAAFRLAEATIEALLAGL
jgi:AcrR family transcriptional regulator